MEIKKEPMKIINCLKGAWTCLSGKREPQIIVWFPLLIKFPTTDQQLNDVDNQLYGEFFLIWWTLDPPKFQKRVRSFSFRELNKTDKYGSTNSESEISLKELRKTLAFALHKKQRTTRNRKLSKMVWQSGPRPITDGRTMKGGGCGVCVCTFQYNLCNTFFRIFPLVL